MTVRWEWKFWGMGGSKTGRKWLFSAKRRRGQGREMEGAKNVAVVDLPPPPHTFPMLLYRLELIRKQVIAS